MVSDCILANTRLCLLLIHHLSLPSNLQYSPPNHLHAQSFLTIHPQNYPSPSPSSPLMLAKSPLKNECEPKPPQLKQFRRYRIVSKPKKNVSKKTPSPGPAARIRTQRGCFRMFPARGSEGEFAYIHDILAVSRSHTPHAKRS